ncbi:MAG: MFS transporter [Chloroflexi bacterium]|nr:MFS transporter [Chloroflexota bacterium]
MLFTVMAVVNTVLIVPAAIIADRWGRKAAIVPSGLLAAVSLIMIGASTTTALFVAGAVVLAVATALAGPAPAAYAADISPPHLRGLGMGMYRSSGDIGFVIGPPLLGAIADWTSYGWAMAVNAALLAVTALFFMTARETAGKRARPGAQQA